MSEAVLFLSSYALTFLLWLYGIVQPENYDPTSNHIVRRLAYRYIIMKGDSNADFR